MRWATLGVTLAWLINSACTGGDLERVAPEASPSGTADALVDPNDRRPSYVVVSIDGFTAGGLTAFAEQDRRIVTFDWENAEGCE